MQQLWSSITDLGDSAVTLPLAGLILVLVVVAREWQIARAWVAMVTSCAIAIGGLKALFGACGERFALAGIVSPSGHTAMSVSIYLSFATLLSYGTPRRASGIISVGGALLVAGIAISRLVLRMHDLPEVIIGFVVGLAAHVLFRWMVGEGRRVATLPVFAMAIASLILIAARHGVRWDVESEIHHVSAWLQLTVPWCR